MEPDSSIDDILFGGLSLDDTPTLLPEATFAPQNGVHFQQASLPRNAYVSALGDNAAARPWTHMGLPKEGSTPRAHAATRLQTRSMVASIAAGADLSDSAGADLSDSGSPVLGAPPISQPGALGDGDAVFNKFKDGIDHPAAQQGAQGWRDKPWSNNHLGKKPTRRRCKKPGLQQQLKRALKELEKQTEENALLSQLYEYGC
jgi:hypothetical protein